MNVPVQKYVSTECRAGEEDDEDEEDEEGHPKQVYIADCLHSQ